MTHQPIFAFDFSMNKPAMASLIDNHLDFFVWPLSLDKVAEPKIKSCYVNVFNRNLPKIHNTGLNEHELILEHLRRSEFLAELIAETMEMHLEKHGISDKSNIIVSNEAFAFSKQGNATLDLSGYKYILMHTLKEYGYSIFKTYSSITIKSTAGCAKKGMGKLEMIQAMGQENQDLHPLIHTVAFHSEILKKKTAFVDCVDDLADAYWCLKTTVKKEDICCILND